jgi:hypothetical protein
VVADRGGDLVAPLADRQVRIADRRYGRAPGGDQRLGGGELVGERPEPTVLAQVAQPPAQSAGVAEGQIVETASQVADRRFGSYQAPSGDQ